MKCEHDRCGPITVEIDPIGPHLIVQIGYETTRHKFELDQALHIASYIHKAIRSGKKKIYIGNDANECEKLPYSSDEFRIEIGNHKPNQNYWLCSKCVITLINSIETAVNKHKAQEAIEIS